MPFHLGPQSDSLHTAEKWWIPRLAQGVNSYFIHEYVIKQKPGVQDSMLDWMLQLHNVPDHGLHGGILFDEVSMQVTI